MTYRNRKLLDLAHDMPCMARFYHVCDGLSEPAHSDQLRHGRGLGHKTGDMWFSAMCHNAHMALDTMTRETKTAEWERAHIRTMEWLWENGKVRVA